MQILPHSRGYGTVSSNATRGRNGVGQFRIIFLCFGNWGNRGGGPRQSHQMTHGGGGPKIGQKRVTYYLNGPLQYRTYVKQSQEFSVIFAEAI